MNKITTYNGGIAIDDRGLLRFVNDFDFKDVKRFYQVENHRQGFVRAWHGHRVEAKYVYVTRGSILLGLVNMVDETEISKYTLSATQPKILYIPPGYYNGFKNLEENTSVIFFSTSTIEEAKGDDIRMPYDRWDIWEEDFR